MRAVRLIGLLGAVSMVSWSGCGGGSPSADCEGLYAQWNDYREMCGQPATYDPETECAPYATGCSELSTFFSCQAQAISAATCESPPDFSGCTYPDC